MEHQLSIISCITCSFFKICFNLLSSDWSCQLEVKKSGEHQLKKNGDREKWGTQNNTP